MIPSLPQLVDAVIVFTAVECAVLLVLHRRTGAGVRPRDFLLNMLSGLCLMLALRAVVRDDSVAWTALWLLAAGVAHGSDIALRWKRRRSDATTRVVSEAAARPRP